MADFFTLELRLAEHAGLPQLVELGQQLQLRGVVNRRRSRWRRHRAPGLTWLQPPPPVQHPPSAPQKATGYPGPSGMPSTNHRMRKASQTTSTTAAMGSINATSDPTPEFF